MTKSKVQVEIISLLNQLANPCDQIEVIERIGKRLRQANSIQTAKEVARFAVKNGVKKEIDYTPVLRKEK